MIKVLNKVFVERFFVINAGFFLFLFLVLFGLLDGRSTINLHHAAMQGITQSFVFQACAMLVWIAYSFKCVSFSLGQLDKPDSGFLYELQALDDRTQFFALLQCHASQFSPLLLYAAITCAVGFKEGDVVLTTVFLLFQLVLCAASAWIVFNQVNSTWKQPVIKWPRVRVFPVRKFQFYLLHYSFHERKGTFLGVKLFSLLLLQAMVAANRDKVSREAICVLIMFLAAAHSLLPVYYVRFIEGGLLSFRNLPVSIGRWFSLYAGTYAIIFLPELAFLLLNAHHALTVNITLSLYAVAVSQSALYTSMQYLPRMTTERYTGVVFVLFFVTLLLLASFSLWWVFAVEAVISVVLFRIFWPRGIDN